jgi:hypothetical protein
MNEQNRKKAYGYVARTIIEVFSDEIVDGERLTTFSLYLKFGIFKAYCPDISIAKSIIPTFFEIAISEVAAKKFDSDFEDNKEVFFDICKDIWSNLYYKEINWLKEWENICTDIFNDELDKEQTCNYLLKVVNDHLEISDEASLVVQLMINRTFQLV